MAPPTPGLSYLFAVKPSFSKALTNVSWVTGFSLFSRHQASHNSAHITAGIVVKNYRLNVSVS